MATVEFNPWNVSSLEEFLFYNCPECVSKYSNREQFVGHAVVAHENSRDILMTILNENVEASDEVNPCNILSLEEFLCYNCPECDYKYYNIEQFVGHAMVAHKNARDILPTILKCENVKALNEVDPEK